MKIDNELKNLIPPLAEDEINQLENNLKNEGWRSNERIITWEGFIVDGHNRYSLCQKHNIKFITEEKKFNDKNEVILWMIDNQLGRRNIPDYARVELNLRKEDLISLGQGFRSDLTLNKVKLDTNKQIAKESHVGHDTVSKVKFIRDNADEETKKELRRGNKELSINKVYIDLKKKKQREDVIQEFKEAPKLEESKRKYSIIYADPPWKYFAGGNKNQSIYYKGMEIEEIKKLPVEKLANDNCILFLWVTFPMLKEVFEVIESWGFDYSTCGFNWVKKTKEGKYHFGLGNWTRSNSELCLIATKGKPIRQSASVSQIIDNQIEQHSKKPDCVRDKIVELVGDLPRIELFSRQKIKGWDGWGNEV
tara:strand:+ start:819 stop:1910 length:1092 start_codon:yes stop_codon:yes gene_type:complete